MGGGTWLFDARGVLLYFYLIFFEVMDFQSYYVFNPSRMADLRVGAAMLREALDRETQKEERSQRQRSLKTYVFSFLFGSRTRRTRSRL